VSSSSELSGDASSALLTETRELLEKVRGGDRSALEDLLARYQSRLERFVRARLPSSLRPLEESADAVQEVMVRVIEALPRFEYQGLGSFWAFLRTIAWNHLLDGTRKQTRRGRTDSLPEDSVAHPASSTSGPWRRAARREEIEMFETALSRVPEKQRQALLLRLELKLDYGTIAVDCGFPSADACRMAIRRVLEQVAKEMSRGRTGPKA